MQVDLDSLKVKNSENFEGDSPCKDQLVIKKKHLKL